MSGVEQEAEELNEGSIKTSVRTTANCQGKNELLAGTRRWDNG